MSAGRIAALLAVLLTLPLISSVSAQVWVFDNVTDAAYASTPANDGAGLIGREDYMSIMAGGIDTLPRFVWVGGVVNDNNSGTTLTNFVTWNFFDDQGVPVGTLGTTLGEGLFVFTVTVTFPFEVPAHGFLEVRVLDPSVPTVWLTNTLPPAVGSSPGQSAQAPAGEDFAFALELAADPICRGAEFWGEHGGSQDGGFNYADSAIEAVNCLSVCGVDICGTDQPDLLGTLGSATEALCHRRDNDRDRPNRPDLNGAYQEMVATALNCALSGFGPENCSTLIDPNLIGISWQACNDNCMLGDAADVELLATCRDQLACWNHGLNLVDLNGSGWGCAPGFCEFGDAPCGDGFDECPANTCNTATGRCSGCSTGCTTDADCPPNLCVTEGGCDDRGFCDSPIYDQFANPNLACPPDVATEEIGPAGGVEECQDALRGCKIETDRRCDPNPCDGFCNGVCLAAETEVENRDDQRRTFQSRRGFPSREIVLQPVD